MIARAVVGMTDGSYGVAFRTTVLIPIDAQSRLRTLPLAYNEGVLNRKERGKSAILASL